VEDNIQIISIIKAISLVNARSFSRLVPRGLICILLIATCFADNVQADPGDLDTSFGFDGKVTTGFGIGSYDSSGDMAIQSDGKIVAVGYSDAGGSYDFALARYNTDGSLDLGFGSGGIVLTDFSGSGSDDLARTIAIQTDGKIVAAGRSDAGGGDDFALARYNTDGSLDLGFGSGGIVLTDFSGGGSTDYTNALAIQTDGKIVAAGRSDAGGSYDFPLARYNTDGSLDLGFGSGGIVLTDFSGGGSWDEALAVAIQADGKIVAAGYSDCCGNDDFALARYLDSTTPPMPGIEPCDANGDGNINILDVTVILNDILEIAPAPGDGDCNEDGEVNILDVTSVLNEILGG
jgi:uncharacterized delta-60 repeat protein